MQRLPDTSKIVIVTFPTMEGYSFVKSSRNEVVNLSCQLNTRWSSANQNLTHGAVILKYSTNAK